MTTLYTNMENKYLVRYDTMKEENITYWKAEIERAIDISLRREKGYLETIGETFNSYFSYFNSYVYPFSLYYRFRNESIVLHLYKDLFSITDKRPAGKWILSYRRYELVGDGRESYKSRPFCLSRSIPGDHSTEDYRLDFMYDENKGFKEYTLLFCIQRDEGLQGGSILFYPHYDEENNIGSTMGQLMGQCSLQRKELDVPFHTGSVVMLSGHTRYSMEPLKGKGTLLMMILDFFSES